MRLALHLVLAGLALVPLAGPAAASPSAAERLERARHELGAASVRLAEARSLGDRAGEAAAAADKAALVRRQPLLVAQAERERARAARARARARAERARAERARADAAAAAAPPASAPASPYVPYTALSRAPGPAPSAAALTPLLDGYLASRQSPLTGLAATFVREGQAAGVDPRFLVAIAGAETSFAVYGPSQAIHNPFGLGPHMSFASWEESIAYAARNLAGSLYAGDGRYTIPQIQARWAPNGAANDPTDLNSNWTRNVSTYFAELGGDPAAAVIGLPVAPATPVVLPEPPSPEPEPVRAASPPPAMRTHAREAAAPDPRAGRAAAEAALGLVGVPYAAGGGDARGLDGPGLVRAAWARAGVSLPGSVAGLAAVGAPLAPQEVRAGDVVLLTHDRTGIYLGAGRFAWAPGPGGAVSVTGFDDPLIAPLYRGALRVPA